MSVLLQELERIKNEGNTFFKQGKYEQAINEYQTAMRTFLTLVEGKKIDNDQEFVKIITTVQIPCYMNCAQCFIKTSQWKNADLHCDEAIKMAQNVRLQDADKIVKLLFRKAKAQMELGLHAGAKDCLEKAYKMAPNNQDVIALMHENSKRTNPDAKKGSNFSFPGTQKKNHADVVNFLNDEVLLESRKSNISSHIEFVKETSQWVAKQDILANATLLIDSGFHFPKDYCFDLIDYMNADPNAKEQYLKLFPNSEYTLKKEGMTIEYKRALRAFREGVKYGTDLRKPKWTNITSEELREFYPKVILNNFPGQKSQYIFPNASFFGHSLSPNAILFISKQGIAFVRSTKKIAKGTPITLFSFDVNEYWRQRGTLLNNYKATTADQEEVKSDDEAIIKLNYTDILDKVMEFSPYEPDNKSKAAELEVKLREMIEKPALNSDFAKSLALPSFIYSLFLQKKNDEVSKYLTELIKLSKSNVSCRLFYEIYTLLIGIASKNVSGQWVELLESLTAFGLSREELNQLFNIKE